MTINGRASRERLGVRGISYFTTAGLNPAPSTLQEQHMSTPGFGVMLGILCGNEESVTEFTSAIGKTICALSLGDDDALHFEFEDGSKLRIADEGQSCCENRYMRTDDNLSDFIGATLQGAEIKEAHSVQGPDVYGEHEVQFLEVKTDRGVFTMASHNEHNGYYGGFLIRASA